MMRNDYIAWIMFASCLVLTTAIEARAEPLALPAVAADVEWKAAPRTIDPLRLQNEAVSPTMPAQSVQPTATSSVTPVVSATQVPATDAAPKAEIPDVLAEPANSPILASSSTYLTGRVWGSADYLHWWLRGNGMPPLVTSAPIGEFGTLNNPQTRVLYGNQQASTNAFNGMRVRAGFWFDPCESCGLDAGFFGFGTHTQNFVASSNGDPGLFRPFFNTNTGAPDAELVALMLPKRAGGFDPILSGTVAVNNSTDFYGWDANFRKRICGDACWRLDALIGYRYMYLQDATSIQENLLSTDPLQVAAPLGTRINVFDRFQTTNTFNGGQIGLVGERRWGRWVANLRATVALGDNHENVKIDGSTQVITPQGVTANYRGGLLALPSNIGSYNSDRFSAISEVAGNIGYQITPRLRVFGGYTFLNWSNVARSGGQIDPVVNPTLIPNNGPVVGPARPAYHLNQTDFFAHGYNAGFQINW